MNEKPSNIIWDAATYQEKMSGLMMLQYNRPDAFFDQAKATFIRCCPSWSDISKVRSLVSIFQNAFKTYSLEERKKLPHRFMVFTEDLPAESSVKEKMFDGFYMLEKNKATVSAFLVEALKSETYGYYVNSLIQNSFLSTEDRETTLLDFFYRYFNTIEDYIKDATFEALSKTNYNFSYRASDIFVRYLIQKRKFLLALSVLKNTCLYFDYASTLREDIFTKCLKPNLSPEEEKKLLRSLIEMGSFSSSILYRYYQLLTPEERENEDDFLSTQSDKANQSVAYGMICGAEYKPGIVSSLPLSDYVGLAPIIKERFKDTYLRYLTKAFNKALKNTYNKEAVFNGIIDAYKDDPDFLSSEIAYKISDCFHSTRVHYLRALYETKTPSFDTSLHLYGE
ncbi:MAG: hypothetical protein PUA93_03655 [Eubacteriales bacterium]|nr:hypothetical protein [Eubacteriales bacterium]